MDALTKLRLGSSNWAGTNNASLNDTIIGNDAYIASHTGGYGGAMDNCGTGRVGLSMLSVMILGVLVFYVGTKGRQL